MNSELPLVSIVTPVYNGADYLEELIESVAAQDYPNIEHIIIDDGSNDGSATVDILRKHPQIRWWSRENRGQYPTMNEGLNAAEGEIVCFISADDVMAHGAVRKAIEKFQENPNYDGVYGKILWMNSDGTLRHAQELISRAPLWFFKYRTFISHCSLYINKKFLEQHELYFDTTLNYVGDFDWIIRLTKAPIRIGYIDQVLSLIRYHPLQATRVHADTIKAESQLIFRRHKVNTILRKVILSSLHWITVIKSLWDALRRGGVSEANQMITERFSRNR